MPNIISAPAEGGHAPQGALSQSRTYLAGGGRWSLGKGGGAVRGADLEGRASFVHVYSSVEGPDHTEQGS